MFDISRMITKPTSIEELKELFVEELLNNTDKITKVSPESVNEGFAFGSAKLAQKILNNISLIESHLFPEYAFGSHLDIIAKRKGIASRFTSSPSSTYVRVVAEPGTVYQQGVVTFNSSDGIVFDLINSVTVGDIGFAYAMVRSQTQGSQTNSKSFTITTINPAPTGHKYVVNEAAAIGGRDNEDDKSFLRRIIEGQNLAARGTLSQIEQVFMKINSNVFRIYNQGVDADGEVVLAVLTQNGVPLSDSEIKELIIRGGEYFSLSELIPYGYKTNYGIKITNINFQPIDISARIKLSPYYDYNDVVREIQIGFNKYLDYRYWDSTKKVEWDDLLEIVKRTEGVDYVYDNYFSPGVDIIIPRNKIPRMRGFLVLDEQGNIITNSSANTLNPVYYNNRPDFSYMSTILRTI